MKQELKSGFTTGACAAAAARGAALMLDSQTLVNEVSIRLPAGIEARFQLHGQKFSTSNASCFVIKDAGDDPDVTNGAEIRATVAAKKTGARGKGQRARVIIEGGVGIGKVTKPGLAVPPGEWAINPVPRRMIEEAVCSAYLPLPLDPCPLTLKVTISIPDGEERARKTLNQRLGIIGGLSILGTTGIVRPISAKAWTDTVDAALDVARACGCETVVLSTGRTSEMAVQKHLPNLPEEAFIMMGDHVAYALRACSRRGFMKPVIACQFAKLLKIACGHENTHASASELDLTTLSTWAEEARLSCEIMTIIANANTAREIAVTCRFDPAVIDLVTTRAKKSTAGCAPGIAAGFIICGYDGEVFWSK